MAGGDNPFVSHAFLSSLEEAGCVGPGTGWSPRHQLVSDDAGLVAAMPLYLKDHSWGEFVFDHAWAEAYARVGLDYYPKLVCAVPFTPVTGPRLLHAGAAQKTTARAALLDAARRLAATEGASSLHVLFPEDGRALARAGMMLRIDCQYHWHDHGYGNFDGFLDTLRSDKRKKIRRERRRVADSGIRHQFLAGPELGDELLDRIYRLHANTFLERGQLPYLNRDFFFLARERLGEALQVALARQDGRLVACAVFFRGPRTLYGRYWGAAEHHDSLHFETCFYQGIEYCLREGLAGFEPGAQGEHKLRRGFEPVQTCSTHWIAREEFSGAIAAYLTRERGWVREYLQDARRHLPYRRGEAPDG